MKFSAFSFLITAASAAAAAAVPAKLSSRQSADIVVTYNGLLGPVNYSFGQCVPGRLNGHVGTSVTLSAFGKCYLYTDANCVHQLLSAPIPVPPGVTVPNIGDFVELVAESGSCEELE